MAANDPLAIGRDVGASVCRHGPWVDDVAQAATVAAWLHPECAVTAAWRAAVTEYRRLSKYDRGRRLARPAALSLDLVVAHLAHGDVVTVADTLASADEPPQLEHLGLKPHEARVVALLAYGFTKAETARVLGRTEGAVSHVLAGLRRKAA